MQLTCPCLNVVLNVAAENEEISESILQPEWIKQLFGEDVIDDPFLALAENGAVAQFMLLSDDGITEKLPICIRKRSINEKWDVRRCLLCGADAYAVRSSGAGGQVLVNTKLFLRDAAMIEELQKSSKISPVFQVILPKTEKIPLVTDAAEMENGSFNSESQTTTMLSRGVLQSVQTCMTQYLNREQEAMEERIRQFIDQEQQAFETKKAEAKADKTTLLRYLARNGGGVFGGESGYGANLDDDFDGALPLSPLSMTSGDPSPALTATVPLNLGLGEVAYTYSNLGALSLGNTPLRPKAMSNPAILNGWKRKRHSGGNGPAPGLTSHAEEHQDIFTFDEHEVHGYERNEAGFLGEDEGNVTDDSGTGEDYTKYYPPPPPPPATSTVKYGFENGNTNQTGDDQFGKSAPIRMPMAIPKVIPNAHRQRPSDGEKPTDVGASMMALALSTQGADDPERLFGERPQRRRWTTGEDQQHARQRQNSSRQVGTTNLIKEQHF